jgi:hypothetical protein
MSGLLMRLGAQATGSGWAVRSDVRLPFGTLGPGPAVSPAAAGDTSPGSVAVDAGETGLRPVTAAPRIAPRSSPRPLSEPGAEPAAATSATEDATVQHDLRHSLQTAPTPLVPRPQTATPGPPRAMPLTLPHAAEAAPGQDRRPSTATDLPEPLLPGRAPDAPRHPSPPPLKTPDTQARSAFGQPQSPAEPDRETEVHIHIGRIEVTALQEAARPKPRLRERVQPMSLDAYLEQRRKVP